MINRGLKQNKRILFTVGGFVLVAVFTLFYFILKEQPTLAYEVNPFIKQMPVRYSRLLKDTKKINDGYYWVINKEGLSDELLIFKEFPTADEQEADISLQIMYTDAFREEKELDLKIETKAVFYNYNDKAYGVFYKQLPKVAIKEINLKKHSYRTDKNKWEVTLKQVNTSTPPLLKFDKENFVDHSIPNAYSYYLSQTLASKKIKQLPYSYDIKKDSLFKITQSLDAYIKQNKATIIKIDNPTVFWDAINNLQDIAYNNITFYGEEKEQVKAQLSSFSKKEILINDIFNFDKHINYLSLKNIFTAGCKEAEYFIFNTTTKLLEPFYVSSKCLGVMAKTVNKPLLTNATFVEKYIKAIEKTSSTSLPEILDKERYQQELALINAYYPSKIYNYHTLLVNRNQLKRSLFPGFVVTAELISISKKNLKLAVRNVSNFPIKIIGLNYKSNKRITTLTQTKLIDPLEKKIIEISLPRSFENLFVHKKLKTTGFRLAKDSYDLRLLFSVLGLDTIQQVSIKPYQAVERIEEDLFRKKIIISNQKEVTINQEKREITFLDSVTVNSPLIIPSGYVLKAKKGTIINIVEGGKIVSNSPLKFIGTKESPIQIYSSDKKGQGIIVLAEGENSYLEHVIFNDLTNPNHGYWTVTGAVTFYESPVKLEYVTINNNRCEDALNIVRTNFLMSHCTISNTQSDAFDGDFVEGTIKDCYFTNLGNDGIDISGSVISIINVTINEAGDKGLSAGENSKMLIDNITITNSEIGIAGKDLSIIEGKNLRITNNKLAFTAFMKKPEFGPSHIKVSEVKLEGIETDYLVESKSSLTINGKKATTIKNVKSKMYGVEFGKSSKDTRNSQ